MQVVFGAGTVMGKRTDAAFKPNIFFGVTQDWSLDIDQKLVTLFGQFKDPVDVAPSERTITGKIKFARIQAAGLGGLIFGNDPTAGAGIDLLGPENHAAIAATTFVITGGASTFLQDLGVFYHNTAIALTPVASAPVAGQYVPGLPTVGNYTIAAADQAVAGGLDVYYRTTATDQLDITMGQALMGTGPTVELNMSVPYTIAGTLKKINFQLYACRIGKIPLSFANTKYMIPEVDYTAFANAAGNVLRWSSTE